MWELLHLCQHQLRLSPMGTIMGFDFNPFLTLAIARGYPVAIIAELLQAAEEGMLESVNNAHISADTLSQNNV